MADRPEPLRLFDLDWAPPTQVSARRTAQTKPPSRIQTRRIPSVSQTEAPPVPKPDTDDQVLQVLAERARLVAETRRHLDEAIDAARAAGHSWRTIGIRTGIPHQTLHQRSQQTGSDRADRRRDG
jgi:hypothetical protein